MKLVKKDAIYISIIAILSCALIICSVVFNMPVKKEDNYYNIKCNSFAVQNANLSSGQIVFLGDSITDFYPLDQYYNTLNLATYNRGIGGDTTQGVLDRLKVSAFDIAPSKIVLMIGANDVYGGQKDNAYIIDKYNKILTQIKQKLPTTQVFCMSVVSQSQKMKDYFEDAQLVPTKINQIIQLNAQIKNLAQQYAYTYVDLFSLTVVEDNYLNPNYTDDGLHLNANGFMVWTDLLKPLLS